MRIAEIRKKEDKAAQMLRRRRTGRGRRKDTFFFPQFDCSVCNALISLIDN